jgi:hypothetical protein
MIKLKKIEFLIVILYYFIICLKMSSYVEKVIWTLLKTSFSKRTFCYLLISFATIILRMHIDAITTLILTTSYNILNFFIRVFVSSFLIIKSKYIYDIIQRYEPEFYNLIRFLINNYTEKNFKRWKRNINLFICIYIYILTFLIDITNDTIRQIIIEYLICYFMIEIYENYMNGKINILQNKEYECKTKDYEIINDLIKNNENINYDPDFLDIKKN